MAFDESKATYKQIINRVKALKEELETGKALGQQDTERYKATQKEYQELTKKYELKSDINQLSKEELELQNKITAEYTATQDEAKKLGFPTRILKWKGSKPNKKFPDLSPVNALPVLVPP